ncbi:16S rRNA (guanine(966)-N(2))-methyltransferase RsmD [Candidatus Riflebacteria bacterium]
MRVIAGLAKGRRLLFPKGSKIRPAMDRIREDIFNILGDSVQDNYILDVFAGTGSVGIEALSRGAKSATFIESNKKVFNTLLKNLDHTGFSERAEVLNSDFRKCLAELSAKQRQFFFIFVDPPYQHNFLLMGLKKIVKGQLLHPAGLIIAELHKNDVIDLTDLGLQLIRQKKYGQTNLQFIRIINENE